MSKNHSGFDAAARRAPGIARIGIIIAIVAVIAAAWGIAHRLHAEAALRSAANRQTGISVEITHAIPAGAGDRLTLPGEVKAFADAPIYARTTGYLKSWRVDIGTRVKSGQLLAEIDTPEIDQQLAQAQADLASAEASNQLAQSTAARWQNLLATDSVSKQDADEKAGDALAKAALVKAARANVARLRQLQSFKRILAPFDGIITARNVDIGDLINPGSSSQRELFHIVSAKKLRIYVEVPQSSAPDIRVGMSAQLHFPEHPDQAFPAKVVSTADAIDPVSRTMRVQLQTDNSTGELLPGAYAEVRFQLPVNTTALRLPANTLLFHEQGIQAAIVDGSGHVAIRTLTLGRDFGKTVEVVSGITSDDAVIINPPDTIAPGDAVSISTPATAARADTKK
ncbi:MAG TPA: efflux RND transporter periplasmic adaptor subunit [Stenotrophobium sp.]|nr:efflux RND transporter periplasmic adaptor subunit [Stenotrophobium sp.]